MIIGTPQDNCPYYAHAITVRGWHEDHSADVKV